VHTSTLVSFSELFENLQVVVTRNFRLSYWGGLHEELQPNERVWSDKRKEKQLHDKLLAQAVSQEIWH
jgi:hypothetical protein